ncbi:MAG: class II fructose-bisphosphatase [Ferrimicrobium sp.]
MMDTPTKPDRNLALDLVRVTEAAALAGSRWMGRGEKEKADGAAVAAMREVLSTVPMAGTVIIGEGEKDHAPMLFNGERVGDGTGPTVDVAVDPIEGTTPTALGRWGAISVIAVAANNAMYYPGPIFYMDKLATGPEGVGVVDLSMSPTDNIRALASAKAKRPSDITAVILDRPRHRELIEEVRAAGARIRLIGDGDVAAALLTAWPESDIDILLGIGGTPEGVIAAAAMHCLDGQIQGRLWPRNDAERNDALEQGYNLTQILSTEDLVHSDSCFFAATGLTDSDILSGVHFTASTAITQSIVMRSRSKTIRTIRAVHQVDKLRSFHLLE